MTKKQLSGTAALGKGHDFFHPGFSIDCVIIGFHEGVLKILLSQYRGFSSWRLPGSFVIKNEDVDVAAYRILKDRTGLEHIFLRQFHLFGDSERKMDISRESAIKLKEFYDLDIAENHWFLNRFITMGYYALVDSSKVHLTEGYEGETIKWHDLHENIFYFSDHGKIVKKAIEMIRLQLGILPVGKELLPDKFTMPELRTVYETILGKSLDRRNFQRKMLSFGYIENLNERRKGGAHKAPNLYRFDSEKYDKAQEHGVIGW